MVKKEKKKTETIKKKETKSEEKKKRATYPAQDQPGLVHIPFLVDDVHKEYERIKAMGFEFNSPPMVARENGPKIAYFKGVYNVVLELFEKA